MVNWLGRRNRDDLPDRILFTLGSLLTVFEPAHQTALATFLTTGQVPAGDLDDTHPDAEPAAAGGDGQAKPTSAAEQEARNRELIAKKIVALGWSEAEDFVAGVLGSLGYATRLRVRARTAGSASSRAATHCSCTRPSSRSRSRRSRPRRSVRTRSASSTVWSTATANAGSSSPPAGSLAPPNAKRDR